MRIQAGTRLRANTFQELIKERDRHEELQKKLSDEMRKMRDAAGGPGPMGLLPESVRTDPKFRKIQREFDISSQQLRKLNQFLLRNFKKEMAEERKKRRGY